MNLTVAVFGLQVKLASSNQFCWMTCSLVILLQAIPGVAFSAHQGCHQGVVKGSDIIPIGAIGGQLVVVKSNKTVGLGPIKECGNPLLDPLTCKELPAHRSPVLGVRSLIPKGEPGSPNCLSFSTNGKIIFWMLDGSCHSSINVDLGRSLMVDDIDQNELKVVTTALRGDFLATGDKLGFLRITKCSEEQLSVTQAH